MHIKKLERNNCIGALYKNVPHTWYIVQSVSHLHLLITILFT